MKSTVFFLQALIVSVMAAPIASSNDDGEGVSVNDDGNIVLRGSKGDQSERILNPTDVQVDQLLKHAVTHEDVNLGVHDQWPSSEYAPYADREAYLPYLEHEGPHGYSQASYPPLSPDTAAHRSESSNEFYPEYAPEDPARGHSEPLRPVREPSPIRATPATKTQEVPIMTGTYELMLKPGSCEEPETRAPVDHNENQVPGEAESSSSRRTSSRHHHQDSSSSQSSGEDNRDNRSTHSESRRHHGHSDDVAAQSPASSSSSWCGGQQPEAPLQPQPAAAQPQLRNYGHRQTHRGHESQQRHRYNDEEEEEYENRSHRHQSSHQRDQELHDRLLDELRSECSCQKAEGRQNPASSAEGHRAESEPFYEGSRHPYSSAPYPAEEHPRPRPHFGYAPHRHSEPHGTAYPHSPDYFSGPPQEPSEQGLPRPGASFDQQPGLQMPPSDQMPAAEGRAPGHVGGELQHQPAMPYAGEYPSHVSSHSGWMLPHNRHPRHGSHFPHFQQQHNPTVHQYAYTVPQYAQGQQQQPYAASAQQVPYAQQSPYYPQYSQHHASRPTWHSAESAPTREKRHHLAPRSLDFGPEPAAGPAYSPYYWQHPSSRAHSAPPYSSYAPSMGYPAAEHYYAGPSYDRYGGIADPRIYEPRESHVSEPHITVQFPPIYPNYVSREYHGSSSSDSSCSSSNCVNCGNQGNASNCGNMNNGCGNCGNCGSNGNCGSCGNCGNCCNCESSCGTQNRPEPVHPCSEPEQPASSPSYVYSYPQYSYASNCGTASCGNQNCQSCQSGQQGADIYGNTGCYAQTGNEAASKAGRLLHSVLCPWQLFSKCEGGSGGGSSCCGSNNGGCGSTGGSCCGSQDVCCEPVQYEPCQQPCPQPCQQLCPPPPCPAPQPVYQPCPPPPCPAPQPVYQPQPCAPQPQPCVQQPQPCVQPCQQQQQGCNQCGGSGCGFCGNSNSELMTASAAEGGRCIRWMFCPWSWFGDRFDNNVNSHRGKHSSSACGSGHC